jgi:hypothetical protein
VDRVVGLSPGDQPNSRSSSLASILAAVVAAPGGDGGAYPSETTVGRTGGPWAGAAILG